MAAGERPEPDADHRPWLPAQLARLLRDPSSVRELAYVVVDELVGETVGLTVTAWPVADARGRLRFDLESSVEVAVTVADLQHHIYDEGQLQRTPRIGDVFAMRLRWSDLPAASELPAWENRLADLATEVYDVTAEARKVSKLAYYARMAGVVPPEKARDLGFLGLADTSDTEVPIKALLGWASPGPPDA